MSDPVQSLTYCGLGFGQNCTEVEVGKVRTSYSINGSLTFRTHAALAEWDGLRGFVETTTWMCATLVSIQNATSV